MTDVVLFHHVQGLTPGVRALADETGDQHLFTDSSLPAYDAAATALVLERVLGRLERI